MTVRDLVWAVGAPVRTVLVAMIRVYQSTLSGWLGGQCRFAPTCSLYATIAIQEHGALRGSAMAAWRIARCNPYGRGGIDPVPAGRRRSASSISGHVTARGAQYDVVVHDNEEARF